MHGFIASRMADETYTRGDGTVYRASPYSAHRIAKDPFQRAYVSTCTECQKDGIDAASHLAEAAAGLLDSQLEMDMEEYANG